MWISFDACDRSMQTSLIRGGRGWTGARSLHCARRPLNFLNDIEASMCNHLHDVLRVLVPVAWDSSVREE